MQHKPFWLDLGGKIGPAILGGTIVGCTLAKRVELTHWVLLAIGLGLILMAHRCEHHR
jgi:hypothetical protein